jgi:hypothetical protein
MRKEERRGCAEVVVVAIAPKADGSVAAEMVPAPLDRKRSVRRKIGASCKEGGRERPIERPGGLISMRPGGARKGGKDELTSDLLGEETFDSVGWEPNELKGADATSQFVPRTCNEEDALGEINEDLESTQINRPVSLANSL